MAQKGQSIWGAPGRAGQAIAAGAHRINANLVKKFDIVNEYAWTTVPKNSELRAEAPNAYVTGYELEFSQLQQFVEGYIGLVQQQYANNKRKPIQDGLDFYKNLYKPGTNNTKINFNFPYFDNNIRNFANNFDDTFSKVSSRGAQFGGPLSDVFGGLESNIIGGAAAVAQFGSTLGGMIGDTSKGSFGEVGAAVGRVADALTNTDNVRGTYIETPKFYQYENTDAPLRVQFILANTIDDGDAEKNLEFIRRFTKINRPTRLGPIAMTFPYIYHIEVPCQRYIEWAFLQDFSVELLGTKRKVRNQSGGCSIVPEAYGCSFAFKSLTVEAANFMEDDLLCSDNCAFEDYVTKQDRSDREADKRARDWKEERDRAISSIKSPDPGDLSIYKRPDGSVGAAGGMGFIPDKDGNAPQFPVDTIFKGAIPRDPSKRSPLEQELAESAPELIEGSSYLARDPGVAQSWRDKDKVMLPGGKYNPSMEPRVDSPDETDINFQGHTPTKVGSDDYNYRRKGETNFEFDLRREAARKAEAEANRKKAAEAKANKEKENTNKTTGKKIVIPRKELEKRFPQGHMGSQKNKPTIIDKWFSGEWLP